MDPPPPTARSDEHPFSVSRRQLFQVVGGVGFAGALGGCATKTTASPLPAQPGPSSPATPPAVSSGPAANNPGPPASRATAAQLLCRDAWGARAARPGGKPHTPNRLTLHHAGVVLGANSNAPGRFRQDQRYHQDQLGWIDIAYHLGIDRDGNIYQLRDPGIEGDTATDYDTTGHFLVICEGDFNEETVSPAQVRGIATAFAWAAQTYRIATGTLKGHRDFAETSCPGTNLYAQLTSGELRTQIDSLLAAGGVDLQPFCGPEAVARVRAIEAGN
ncbi:peptidoglycan recognition protein family protein [Mycobacterium vicinigordonae]|uniref:N-acetylmuramoyl-L-alanine amidase n=1 Tax=Mycobacterium vicinigordonae TaxID=1719132 RepID=A0A7D6HW35_9MYCO|nr:peptidoglycan recognition family protein [Mycobacterium vicinigordonae]QLL08792.1 N-acetylmuramoyl-L-alanine amidase [Mycobacterium vicinigordonae]